MEESNEILKIANETDLLEKIVENADVATIMVVITSAIVTIFTVYLSTNLQKKIELKRQKKELRDELSSYIANALYLSELYSSFDNQLKVHQARSSSDDRVDGFLSVYENIDNVLLNVSTSKVRLQLLFTEYGIESPSTEVAVNEVFNAVSNRENDIEDKCTNLIKLFKSLKIN